MGERLEEREAGATETVLAAQFTQGIAPLDPAQFAHISIAYEPVWAIGSGKPRRPKSPKPRIIFYARKFALSSAPNRPAPAASCKRRHVKPDNVKALMSQQDIDGALVGGASLDPATFASIVNF